MESSNMNAPTHVSVGCKLPNGLILDLKTNSGDAQRVTLKGANAARIIGGYGITENVPAAFMDQWLKKNQRHPAVVNGSIFLHNDTESAEAIAKERRDIATGLDAIDPLKLGMLKGPDGKADPEALKSYNHAKATNPERNRQRVE
jgi:hypothetical protein